MPQRRPIYFESADLRIFLRTMDIRRSSLTADRRRRLLTEESGLAPSRDDTASRRATSSPSSPRKIKRVRKERYTPDASWEAQPRITDLIPRRKLTIAGWFTLGVLCVVGLEWLYALMPSIAKQTTDGRVAAFDLDGEGSLAAYFSSMILFFAGCSAVLIYTLRRHRLDDYRARYRIWLWAAMVWMVMSVDESGSLHEGFKEFMAYATGSRLYGDGSLWWVIAYGATLGVIGVRLLWDMRTYRPSTTALALSAVSFFVAVVVQLELLLPQRGAQAVMVEEGCEMAGALFLLLAMVLHARFIIFDIEGRYKKAKASSADTKTTEESTEDSETKSDPEPQPAEDELPASSRKGTGLLPWRLGRKKKATATEDHDNSEGPRAKSRRNKPEKKRQQPQEVSESESGEPQLTRRERKAIAKREKQEAAELRRMEKEEKRRLDKAEKLNKPKRLGFLRRKPREEVAVGADEAPAKKQTTKQSEQPQRKPQPSQSEGDADSNSGGNRRQLTKAERKALRRKRRRQERDRNADDE